MLYFTLFFFTKGGYAFSIHYMCFILNHYISLFHQTTKQPLMCLMSLLDETVKGPTPIHMQPSGMSYAFVTSLNIMTPCMTPS